MKQIFGYVQQYLSGIRPYRLLLATLFIGVAIFINYHFLLHHQINSWSLVPRYLGWLAVFLTAFFTGYLLQPGVRLWLRNKRFLLLLLLAPALFAWKMTGWVSLPLSPDPLSNEYWNLVLYWPIKLVIMLLALYIIWTWYDKGRQPYYGFSTKEFHLRPYGTMLLLMVPLVAAAATQKDFQLMYPKLQHLHDLPHIQKWYYCLLYELSYGLDFVSIEVFFRGFLVLAFCRWAGSKAILPMALFYCTIHFGKPMGECISSYFGGMLLGIVTYRTGSIYGGLIVHLGIAWLMELGGYVGNMIN